MEKKYSFFLLFIRARKVPCLEKMSTEANIPLPLLKIASYYGVIELSEQQRNEIVWSG
jgi:hypothetical protein